MLHVRWLVFRCVAPCRFHFSLPFCLCVLGLLFLSLPFFSGSLVALSEVVCGFVLCICFFVGLSFLLLLFGLVFVFFSGWAVVCVIPYFVLVAIFFVARLLALFPLFFLFLVLLLFFCFSFLPGSLLCVCCCRGALVCEFSPFWVPVLALRLAVGVAGFLSCFRSVRLCFFASRRSVVGHCPLAVLGVVSFAVSVWFSMRLGPFLVQPGCLLRLAPVVFALGSWSVLCGGCLGGVRFVGSSLGFCGLPFVFRVLLSLRVRPAGLVLRVCLFRCAIW